MDGSIPSSGRVIGIYRCSQSNTATAATLYTSVRRDARYYPQYVTQYADLVDDWDLPAKDRTARDWSPPPFTMRRGEYEVLARWPDKNLGNWATCSSSASTNSIRMPQPSRHSSILPNTVFAAFVWLGLTLTIVSVPFHVQAAPLGKSWRSRDSGCMVML